MRNPRSCEEAVNLLKKCPTTVVVPWMYHHSPFTCDKIQFYTDFFLLKQQSDEAGVFGLLPSISPVGTAPKYCILNLPCCH